MSSDVHTDAGPAPDSRDVRLLLLVGSLFVAAIVLITFCQVVLRFGFNNPQTWAEEVARYLFVWIVFLGSAIAFSRDSHIRLDAIVNLMPNGPRRVVDLLRRLVEAGAVGVLLYTGIVVAYQNRNSVFYTMPHVPQVLFYLAVPVGSALMLFYIVRNLVKRPPA